MRFLRHTLPLLFACVGAFLACQNALADGLEKAMPAFEVLLRDSSQPIKESDLDVVVFMSPEECTPATSKNLFGQSFAVNNTSMLYSWACIGLIQAAGDPKQKLAFIPTSPDLKQPSAVATVQALPESPTGRRYSALVNWHIENVSSTSSCNFIACLFLFTVSSEIAVIDRLENKLVWHSIQNIPSSISTDHYDDKSGQILGPEAIAQALAPLLAENYAQRKDAAGLLRSTALESDPAIAVPGTVLNKKTNLIIFNKIRERSKHPSDAYYKRGYRFEASHLPQRLNSSFYYMPYKTHIALQLPPGKYELFFEKEPYIVEIQADGPPVYLSLSTGLFNPMKVEKIDATQALSEALKSTNAMVPEVTPGSYPQQARPVFWTQP